MAIAPTATLNLTGQWTLIASDAGAVQVYSRDVNSFFHAAYTNSAVTPPAAGVAGIRIEPMQALSVELLDTEHMWVRGRGTAEINAENGV